MEENFKFFETCRENEKSCGNKINGEWKKLCKTFQEGKTRGFLWELKHFDFKVFYMQERGAQTEVLMSGIA